MASENGGSKTGVGVGKGLTFSLQIGLTRETVTYEGGELTLPALKDIACAFVDRRFPEYGSYGLQEKILLFWHDLSDSNILKKITDTKDIKHGTLVELVLSASTTSEELRIRPHCLNVHSYKTPHFCDFCGVMLFGLVRQGLKCDGCGKNFHKHCTYKIPNNCSNRRGSLIHSPIGSDEPVMSNRRNKNKRLSTPSNFMDSRSSSIIDLHNRTRPVSWDPLPGFDGRIQVPHTFSKHTYGKPTQCQYCKKLLKGVFQQGMQCKDCKFNCHKKCAELVPKDCQGSRLSLLPGSMPSDSEAGSETDSLNPVPETPGEQTPPDDEDNDEPPSPKPSVSPTNSSAINIPLQRIFVSVKHKGRKEVIREGWLVHYTNKDHVRKRHYWKLDTNSLTLSKTEAVTQGFKVMKLRDVTAIEDNKSPASSDNPSHGPHVFELRITDGTVYYVGEDPTYGGTRPGGVHSIESGVGREHAQHFEAAIRQAMMPVTPQPSTEPADSKDPKKPTAEVKGVVKDDISTLYQIFPDDVLGSGQFGIVYGGKDRKTSAEVAIKVIDKLRFPTKQEAQLKNEVSILQNLSHPGVVNLEKMFETPERIFVVMEKLKGDMLEMILSSVRGRLTERVTKFLVSQVLVALKHLHSKSIVHCDLKPENVLLSSEIPFPQVKLCDFGFARIIGEKSFRRSVVGTPAYLAPEVLKNRGYNRSLDMWSVGVIIYVSLSGTFPFNEDEEIAEQITNAAFMYPPNPWKEISGEAIDMIRELLKVDKDVRLSVSQAQHHPWMHEDYQCWCDLRKLESYVGQRYLTHESDDMRWDQYRVDHKLGDWKQLGQQGVSKNDHYSFQKKKGR